MSVYSTLSCRDAPQRFAACQFSKCIYITLSYIFSLHLMQKLELPSRNSLLSMPETDKKKIGWLSQKDVSLARGHTNAHNTFHFMVLLYLQTYLNIPFISLKLMPTAHESCWQSSYLHLLKFCFWISYMKERLWFKCFRIWRNYLSARRSQRKRNLCKFLTGLTHWDFQPHVR